jgi:hypothetical protein
MTKILDLDLDDDDEGDILKNGILQDGKSLRTHMYARDGSPLPGFTDVQRAIAATKDAMRTFDASLHRPGFRRAAATSTADSAHQTGHRFGVFDAAKEKAYADRDRELTNSWRGNTGAGTSTGRDTNNDSRRDAQQTMDTAYAEYDLRIQNSWRNQS